MRAIEAIAKTFWTGPPGCQYVTQCQTTQEPSCIFKNTQGDMSPGEFTRALPQLLPRKLGGAWAHEQASLNVLPASAFEPLYNKGKSGSSLQPSQTAVVPSQWGTDSLTNPIGIVLARSVEDQLRIAGRGCTQEDQAIAARTRQERACSAAGKPGDTDCMSRH